MSKDIRKLDVDGKLINLSFANAEQAVSAKSLYKDYLGYQNWQKAFKIDLNRFIKANSELESIADDFLNRNISDLTLKINMKPSQVFLTEWETDVLLTLNPSPKLDAKKLESRYLWSLIDRHTLEGLSTGLYGSLINNNRIKDAKAMEKQGSDDIVIQWRQDVKDHRKKLIDMFYSEDNSDKIRIMNMNKAINLALFGKQSIDLNTACKEELKELKKFFLTILVNIELEEFESKDDCYEWIITQIKEY